MIQFKLKTNIKYLIWTKKKNKIFCSKLKYVVNSELKKTNKISNLKI